MGTEGVPAVEVKRISAHDVDTETTPLGRKFFVAGNWKSNGTRGSITKLVEELNKSVTPEESQTKRKKKKIIPARINKDYCEMVVAPPSIYIPQVVETINRDAYEVAGQNCWTTNDPGLVFRGETSADQLRDVGCKWVILGHSERRNNYPITESDTMVATKTAYALSLGLSVMACIGDSTQAHDSGKTTEVCLAQMQAYVNEVKDWANVVVAYEPVWAIGSTGGTTVISPDQAQAVHAAVRGWLREKVNPTVAAATRIVYGGPTTAANCKALARMPDIDGFLVTGAAGFNADEFTTICMASSVKLETQAHEEEKVSDEQQERKDSKEKERGPGIHVNKASVSL